MKYFRWTNYILLSFLCVNSLNAQIISHYGIKVSVVRSNFSVNDIPIEMFNGVPFQYTYPEDAVVHPALGIYAQHSLGDNLGIEAELSYVPKGGAETYDLNVLNEESLDVTERKHFRSEENLQYLQFGINLQPKVELGSSALYASVGPTVEYNVSIGNLMKEDVKDINFGYTIGIGFDVNTQGRIPLFVEAKYNGDFSSAFSNHGNYWNRAYIVSLGVRL